MKPIRIVLADDHWLMRDEMRRVLGQQADLSIVGEAEDGQQAVELVERLQPDIVILDIRMPKLNGIEVIRHIKERGLDTKALILTAYDDDDYILALMEAGAFGYLLKTAKATELIDAVRRVSSGEIVLHPAIAAKMARIWMRDRESTTRGLIEQLSPREQEVIKLAAKGLRNKAISEKLNISNRTVEGHLNSIFGKLGVSSRVEAVLYALSQHLVTLEEEDAK